MARRKREEPGELEQLGEPEVSEGVILEPEPADDAYLPDDDLGELEPEDLDDDD